LPEKRRLFAEGVWRHTPDRDSDPRFSTLVTEKTWEQWLERLYSLRRDKRGWQWSVVGGQWQGVSGQWGSGQWPGVSDQ
jgi:hypothetical protein